MLVRATSLKVGDTVKGSDSPIKSVSYANGSDGKDRHMVGGEGLETAMAVRISFEDGSESLEHPAKEILILSRRQDQTPLSAA